MSAVYRAQQLGHGRKIHGSAENHRFFSFGKLG
jgi:hypothetical protein